MRPDEVRKLQAVVEHGPYNDKDFLRSADKHWSDCMRTLKARHKLIPYYSTVLRKKTKERMRDRKSDYYLRICNELDKRLKDPDFVKMTRNFDHAVREVAWSVFDQLHLDLYTEFVLFFGQVETSSPSVN